MKDKMPKPRKKRYLKEKFFEGFFAFWFSRGGVFLSIIISGLSFYFLKLDATKDWWAWLAFFCLTYGSPAIIRFKYFRGIPDGWTREQAEEYQKLEGKTKKIVDSFSRKYWLVILCIVCIFVGVDIAFNEIGLVAIVPGILIIAFFGYVFKIAYQARSKMSDAQVKNNIALSKALYEAKYGKANKSVLKKMVIVVIFVIGFFFFSIGGKLPILNEMQSIVLVIGIVSLIVGVGMWRSINKKELSHNEKTLKKLRREFGIKD